LNPNDLRQALLPIEQKLTKEMEDKLDHLIDALRTDRGNPNAPTERTTQVWDVAAALIDHMEPSRLSVLLSIAIFRLAEARND